MNVDCRDRLPLGWYPLCLGRIYPRAICVEICFLFRGWLVCDCVDDRLSCVSVTDGERQSTGLPGSVLARDIRRSGAVTDVPKGTVM